MILHCEEAKYIRIVYNTMCNDMTTEPNIVNWCSLLRDLLFLIGLPGAWFFQDVGDVKLFLKIVKTQINDIFLQHWQTRVDCSSRALFYKHVADFKFQPYSDSLIITKRRYNLTQLRLSSHRLCIETGRWKKPICTPLDERKCIICLTVEDEFHFVCECKM